MGNDGKELRQAEDIQRIAISSYVSLPINEATWNRIKKSINEACSQGLFETAVEVKCDFLNRGKGRIIQILQQYGYRVNIGKYGIHQNTIFLIIKWDFVVHNWMDV